MALYATRPFRFVLLLSSFSNAASSSTTASAAATSSTVTLCYRQDTHAAYNSSIWMPCHNDTPFSMCYRYSSTALDVECLLNGLAKNIDTINEIKYWREGCTDETWQSEYCLTAFSNCADVDDNGSVRVSACDGPSGTVWCCGTDTSCCSTSSAITIAAQIGQPISSSSSSTSTVSTTSTSSTSTTSSSRKSNTAIPSSSSGLSSGEKAGISVGALAFVVLCLLIGIALLRSSRSRKGELEKKGDFGTELNMQKPPQQLDDNEVMAQLDSREVPAQLYGSETAAPYDFDARYTGVPAELGVGNR